MSSIRQNYQNLISHYELRCEERTAKHAKFVNETKCNLTKTNIEQLTKIHEKAMLNDRESFLEDTINILKVGIVNKEFQIEAQSLTEQLKAISKAEKKIVKILNEMSDESFPHDSMINSYLYQLSTETSTPICNIGEIRTKLSQLKIALDMFQTTHSLSKSERKLNHSHFIIKLMSIFEVYGGNVSMYKDTHFHDYVKTCMELIGVVKDSHSLDIEKSLVAKKDKTK